MRRLYFEDLSKFSLLSPHWAPKGASPFIFNKSESPSYKQVSYHVWLKLA